MRAGHSTRVRVESKAAGVVRPVAERLLMTNRHGGREASGDARRSEAVTPRRSDEVKAAAGLAAINHR
jgi:hypothetical protein